MIDQVTLKSGDRTTFLTQGLAKFEAGTPPISSVVGLSSTLDFITNSPNLLPHGLKSISEWTSHLTQACHAGLLKIPTITVLGPKLGEKRGPLLSFFSTAVHSSDIATFLNIENIAVRSGHHCCQPLHSNEGSAEEVGSLGVVGGSSVRASFGMYNTEEDVSTFLKALKDTIVTFREFEIR